MTNEEQLRRLNQAIMLLGEVYQSLSYAPALTFAEQTKRPDDGILYLFGEPDNKGNVLTTQKEEVEMLIDVVGVSVNKTPRKDGRYQGYAIINGDKRYFYGKTYEETVEKVNLYWKEKTKEEKRQAKEIEKEVIRMKAQQALEEEQRRLDAAHRPTETPSGIPLTLQPFMEYYFTRFRSRKVAEDTLKNDKYRCKNHIFPAMGSMFLSDITDDFLQNFVDDLTVNSLKTAKECNSILSGMFNFAVSKQLVNVNPCRLVIIEPYESEHGVALTMEEEEHLIASLQDNPKYLIPLAVVLYTGLRPCEYRTARIDGKFIVAQNRKRHSKEIEYKHIPIRAPLAKILGDSKEIYFPNRKYLREYLVSICPEHKLYDLRTTFNTRCKTAKVDEFARKKWMGHGIDRLEKAYNALSPEWYLNEMKNVDKFFGFDT